MLLNTSTGHTSINNGVVSKSPPGGSALTTSFGEKLGIAWQIVIKGKEMNMEIVFSLDTFYNDDYIE